MNIHKGTINLTNFITMETLKQQYKAIWLDTEEETILNASSYALAWQEAIELRKEDFTRMLLPQIEEDIEHGIGVSFASIRANDHIRVEKVSQVCLTVYLRNGQKVSYTSTNPLADFELVHGITLPELFINQIAYTLQEIIKGGSICYASLTFSESIAEPYSAAIVEMRLA